jgi:hypothetical protein
MKVCSFRYGMPQCEAGKHLYVLLLLRFASGRTAPTSGALGEADLSKAR